MTEVALQARMEYEKKLVEYIRSRCLPPSSWELRQKNAEFKFEAVDHFRKNSHGEQSSAVWKLERELASIYEQMVDMNKKVRKASLGEEDRPCAAQLDCSCTDDGVIMSPTVPGATGSP